MALIVADPGGTNCRFVCNQRCSKPSTRRDLRWRILRRSSLGKFTISRSIRNSL